MAKAEVQVLNVCNHHERTRMQHEQFVAQNCTTIAIRCLRDIQSVKETYRTVWPLGLLLLVLALDSTLLESLSQDLDLAKVRVAADALNALLSARAPLRPRSRTPA
jgi:hypothetical protein